VNAASSDSPAPSVGGSSPRPEVTTVADDEVVVFRGALAEVRAALPPDTDVDLGFRTVRTLPARGERLATVTTVNDVHFGETVCGRIDGLDLPTFAVEPGATPYPEVMSAGAVAAMAAVDPDCVVVKGDLTSNGTRAEYERFLEVYGGAFGDRLLHVRGNHESYHDLDAAAWPTQERVVDGAVLALLDTSRSGTVNGRLSEDQLDWLDELGARADRPVLVFGHHPVWDPSTEPRTDTVFGLLPEHTEALVEVFARRPRLALYAAGHTHRNHVVRFPDAPEVPFVEAACVKDFPGSWVEYRVFDDLVLHVHRRIDTPEALEWSERTRGIWGGDYVGYALGRLEERSLAVDLRDRA
jgi:3',5'-cyclic AMP phosphodiesterase CpdA